jgi:hypothetical protein
VFDPTEDRFHDCSGQQYPSTNDYRTDWPPGAGEAGVVFGQIRRSVVVLLSSASDSTYLISIYSIRIRCVHVRYPIRQNYHGSERLDTFADESVALRAASCRRSSVVERGSHNP